MHVMFIEKFEQQRLSEYIFAPVKVLWTGNLHYVTVSDIIYDIKNCLRTLNQKATAEKADKITRFSFEFTDCYSIIINPHYHFCNN